MMREVSAHLPEIFSGIRKNGAVLLIDFDGTLSSIVQDPRTARLSPPLHKALLRCAKRMPTAIISGRALSDVKRRVGIRGISYAGSHGLESELPGGKRFLVPTPEGTARVFREAKAALKKIVKRYRGIIAEDKHLSFALNYRALSPSDKKRFESDARQAVERYGKRLRVIDDLYTFDIMPALAHDKGTCAKKLYKKLRRTRAAVPLYIGDSKTDEDAFRAFPRGITIRIGRKAEAESAARFYFANRRGLSRFLSALADQAAPADQGALGRRKAPRRREVLRG